MYTFQRKTKTIEVEGQTVHLKEATEGEIQEYGNSFHDAKGRPVKSKMVDARVKLIQLCVVDENGERTLDAPGFAAEIRGWPSSVTKKIHSVCAELCGLDDEDSEEEFEKKSSD